MARTRGANTPIIDLVDSIDDAVVRRLLVAAAASHEDVARALRLAAADDAGRLSVLRDAVDDRLRTRRSLDYWASSAWAREAAPVLDALATEVEHRPSTELVSLLQRAAEHLVKVILHADDSNGEIGGLAAEVLRLHQRACAAGAAEPRALAKWMVQFTFENGFFTIDPVAYAEALGDGGLAVYRQEVAKRSAEDVEPLYPSLADVYGFGSSFATRYATERLAILDQDIDRIIELFGGDLSSSHQYARVAEAMIEIGRSDEALACAQRGIGETSGWQVARLYDLSAEILDARGEHLQVLDLRREQHGRMPSASTYAALRAIAEEMGVWANEIDHARSTLGEVDQGALVDVLLADGEADRAWFLATSDQSAELGLDRWRRLAQSREGTEPTQAMDVYLRLAEASLVEADRRNYQRAIKDLKLARNAALASGLTDQFAAYVTALRDQHRRRPTLIHMLDKAKLL